MSIEYRIRQFMATCNMGDEISLSRTGSLILGYGASSFYLIDTKQIVFSELTYVGLDPHTIAGIVDDWAQTTGTPLWYGIYP